LLLGVVFYKTVSIVVSTGDFGFILSSVVASGSGHYMWEVSASWKSTGCLQPQFKTRVLRLRQMQ